ncbi:MAG: hypothetical protein ABR568_20015 [Pyrinomonadaceae bacterium]
MAIPPERELASPNPLADAVAAMKRIKDAEKRSEAGKPTPALPARVVATTAGEQPRLIPKTTRNPLDLARLSEPELPFEEAGS